MRYTWLAVLAAVCLMLAGCPTDGVQRTKIQPCTKDCRTIEIRFSSPTERTAWVRTEASTPDGHQESTREHLERMPHSEFIIYSPGVHVTIKAWAEVNYGAKMDDVNVQRSVVCEIIDQSTGAVIIRDDGKSLGLAGHAFCKHTT